MATLPRGVLLQQNNVVADVRQQLNELRRKLIERQRDFQQQNNEIISTITELTIRLDNVGKPSELPKKHPMIAELDKNMIKVRLPDLGRGRTNDELTSRVHVHRPLNMVVSHAEHDLSSTVNSSTTIAGGVSLKSRVEGRGRVYGMTLQGDQLFLSRDPTESRLEVHRANDLAFMGFIHINGLGNRSYGLTSCGTNNCLYVCDWSNESIHRVELTDKRSTSWKVVHGKPMGLSVTPRCTLLVTIEKGELTEYDTHGQLIRRITLMNITDSVHAIQWNSSDYLVSHGGPEHGVCVVNRRGRVLQRYDYEPGSLGRQLSDPRYLAAGKNGQVYVSDQSNNRVVVLDRMLKWTRDLTASVDGGMKQPLALCLDEPRDRLFVSEWGTGNRLLVVNVR